jgi:hypothetical protein
MRGQGTFFDPRLDAEQYPLAYKLGNDNLRHNPDLFTRSKGGFYHDGRFADLNAVGDH